MKEFNVKRVWNFPIALMAKGVQCFMMNGFADQGNTLINLCTTST